MPRPRHPRPLWAGTTLCLSFASPRAKPTWLWTIGPGDSPCRLELGHGSQVWLGSTWGLSVDGSPESAGRFEEAPLSGPIRWAEDPSADLFEWNWKEGDAKRTRTVSFLKAKATIFLADLVESEASKATLTLQLPNDVQATPLPDARAIKLSKGKGRSVTVVPLGLPSYTSPTERGSIKVVETLTGGRAIELTHNKLPGSGPLWLPLAITWRSTPLKPAVNWRVLTVSESGQMCSPAKAFAARLGWDRGPSENLLFYKSFLAAERRAFLGYQTLDRLVVASFLPDKQAEPIVSIAAGE